MRHFYAVEQKQTGQMVHKFNSKKSRDKFVAEHFRARASLKRDTPPLFGKGAAALGHVEARLAVIDAAERV